MEKLSGVNGEGHEDEGYENGSGVFANMVLHGVEMPLFERTPGQLEVKGQSPEEVATMIAKQLEELSR